jgi:hypothetical protein
MKTNSIYSIVMLAVFLCPRLQMSIAFGQGSLTPPGAPAPTMKTLDQISQQVTNLSQALTNQFQQQKSLVEPRTPILAFGTTLVASGSYYLATNLVSGSSTGDGILVRTNNVTIDLNGFSIISTTAPGADSPAGIRIDGSLSAISNVTVCNGRITGFDRAVRVQYSFSNIIVDNIHAANCRRAGIEANTISPTGSQNITIRRCVVDGIDATGEGANVAADGIALVGCTAVVDTCVVRNIVPVGTGTGSCINAATCTNTFVINNFLSQAASGLQVSGGGTRVYYRDNLTAGCGTAFSGTGGVDRGGNF